MGISRTKARKVSMIILYQFLLYKKNNIESNVNDLINANIDVVDEFVEEIVNGVITNFSSLEISANKYLKNWTLDRLGFTDQAIILIALYELINTKTEPSIIINEAIELAKKYSDEAVEKMINGLLDKFYHLEIEKNE